MGFTRSELYGGNRFWAPLSESALLEAGRAARLSGGMTLLEEACGNGAAALFLSEEFHVYARGLEATPEILACACEHARRSPAGNRARFYLLDAAPDLGPVDVVCSLRRPTDAVASMVRPGGCLIWGRYLASKEAVEFPSTAPPPEGRLLWSRVASPLEWERFLAPQERALRAYRRELGSGVESPVAVAAARRIRSFRAHGACVSYELRVIEVPGS